MRHVARRRADRHTVILRYHRFALVVGAHWLRPLACRPRSLLRYRSTMETKQRRYRVRMVGERERRYLDVGVSTDEWRSMTADQQAVYVRWRNWYRARRAMRELLAGGDPSRFPSPPEPSPTADPRPSSPRREGPRKSQGDNSLYRGTEVKTPPTRKPPRK